MSVLTRRSAGISLPLFSARSTRSWGLGEIGDLPALMAWLRLGRQSILQLLPINEMSPEEYSPYSALSAMAINPQFISIRLVPDFPGEDSIDADTQAAIRAAQSAHAIDYPAVRALKRRALLRLFERFWEREWTAQSRRAQALEAFIASQAWWIADYGLYRALRARAGEQSWTTWDPPLRDRQPEALAESRDALARDILFYQYLQWIAHEQWLAVRQESSGVAIVGDFPFMVALDSADVWARQDEFILSASVGTPPDAFSPDGQNWGLPPYRWDALAKDDFEWLRLRARRSADLYDGFRVDHLVGFYRTYIRPLDGATPYFHPSDESAQRALGERLLALFAAPGATIMVEDLGTVPDFVRDSVARAGVPGYRVLRWEREHHLRGRPFIDPVAYPQASVATTGTHDTETLAVWWDGLPPAIRRAVGEVPSIRARQPDLGTGPFSPGVRDTLLEALFASGSNVLVLPIQDVFGSRDRINEPATMGGHNWTYLLPQPVDMMTSADEPLERAEMLRAWTERFGRAIDEPES